MEVRFYAKIRFNYWNGNSYCDIWDFHNGRFLDINDSEIYDRSEIRLMTRLFNEDYHEYDILIREFIINDCCKFLLDISSDKDIFAKPEPF